jgi:hypothetical protein
MVSLGYHKVYLKMNCKMVVDDVNNIKANHSNYGSIIQEYRSLLSNYNGFIIVFTKRQTNGRVHAQEQLYLMFLAIFFI